MIILCRYLFKRFHPSKIIYFEKVLNYKVQEFAPYKSSCSGNLRWCCHLCYTLGMCSLENDVNVGSFWFFGENPLTFGMLICLRETSEMLSQVLISLKLSSRGKDSFEITISCNCKRILMNTLAFRVYKKEATSDHMPI